MATLAGNSIASSYTSLLKLNGNTDSTAAGNGSNAIQVKTGDDDATPLFLNTDRLGINTQPESALHFNTSSSGGIGGRLIIDNQASDADGNGTEISFFNAAGASASGVSSSRIRSVASGNTNGYSQLQFWTYHASEGQRMTLTSDGNLGIGANSPEEKIHSTGAIVSTGVNATGATAGTERAFIDLVSNKARIGHFRGTTSAGSGGLQLYTDSVERMKIDASGNVGINGDPSFKLDVNYGSPSSADATIARFMVESSRQLGLVWDDSASTLGLATLTSHNLVFHIGGNSNPKMLIDTSGNVGVGSTITNPSAYEGSADNLVVGATSGAQGITIVTGNTSKGKIHFADGTTGAESYSGYLLYDHNGDAGFQFGIAATTRFAIDQNSRISLGNNDSSGATSNTIFGRLAGNAVASGAIDNVLIGNEAGNDITTGDYNVAIGSHALSKEDVGRSSIAIGASALGSQNTVGEGSVNTIGIGTNAGYYNVTGTENVHIGHNSGLGTDGQGGSNITAVGNEALKVAYGQDNVAIGRQAGLSVTSGVRNCLIGNNTGDAITTANYVTAVGIFAGSAINHTDANGTTLLGYSAGLALTSGQRNLAIGYESLYQSDECDDSIAIGYQALAGTDAGANTKNIAIGNYALDANMTNCVNNIAIGYEALTAATGGVSNVAIGGSAAGAAITTADRIVAIGDGALGGAAQSDGNTGVGYACLYSATGAKNTAFGYQTANTVTDGTENTVVGWDADASASGAVNQTVIGSETTGVSDNSVTLGNASVTDVYMSQDSDAYVHSQNVPNHVANTMSSPYYRTDGVDDFLSHTNTTLLDVFTNDDDVSFEVLFKMPNTLNEQLFSYGLSSSNFIQFFISSGDLFYRTLGYGSTVRHRVNQTLFEAGKIYHLAITMVAGSHPTIYINGSAISFTPAAQVSDDAIANSGLQIGRGQLSSPAYGEFEFYRFKAFNLILDATEVKELYSGASVPYKYKNANQTNLFGSLDFTSGWSAVNASITDSDTFASTSANGYLSRNFGAGDIGKQYRLRIAGTVSAGILQVQNVNGSSNILTGLSGTFDSTTEYTYEGTDDQPAIIRLTSSGATADITHFSLVRVGGVYEYDGSGIASDKWFDKSGNDKHLTVSGATVENAPSDGDGLVYDEGTWEASFTVVGSGSITADTSNNTCWYKRIGNIVHVGGRVYVDSVSSPSGQVYITGIPFAFVDGAEGSDLSTGSIILYDPASDTTGYVGIELAVAQQGFLMREGAGLASGVVGIADHFDANTLVGFQMTYPITI